jgi:hypothetical protein
VIDDHERIEELLAGYVLRSLSGPDAHEADLLLSDHVPECRACRDSLDAYQHVAADLAFAAQPVSPPETMLPRLHRELEPRATRRRPMQVFAVAAGVAAVVGLAGLSVSQSMRADDAAGRASELAHAVGLVTRDGTRMVDVGPVQEISAPGEDQVYVAGEDVPTPPAGSVYRVWLVSGGEPTFVRDFLPDGGRVFLTIPFDPARYDDLWIAIEPAGAPTFAPSSQDWWSASESAAA